MKVLGFLVPAAKGAGRDDDRRRTSKNSHVKTIRASGFPSTIFRPSTDTNDDRTDNEDEGPFFDLIFPLSSPSDHEFFFSGNLITLDTQETTRSRPHNIRVIKRNHEENGVSGTMPLSSLLARDNGLRVCTSARSASAKLFFELGSPCQDHHEKRPNLTSTPLKIHKYFSKIKPFYVRVSRGFGERLRFGPAVEQSGVKMVARRLRKSRSASSAVVAVRSPAAEKVPLPRRRDDSLVEMEDGIEGAIAHCKRSFNKGSMELPLVRSRSDPGEGKRVTI